MIPSKFWLITAGNGLVWNIKMSAFVTHNAMRAVDCSEFLFTEEGLAREQLHFLKEQKVDCELNTYILGMLK